MVDTGDSPCCANCCYAFKGAGIGNALLECRYEPPKVFMFTIPMKGVVPGQSAVQMRFQSKFPDVDPTHVCGKHPQYPRTAPPFAKPSPPPPPPKK